MKNSTLLSCVWFGPCWHSPSLTLAAAAAMRLVEAVNFWLGTHSESIPATHSEVLVEQVLV